MLPGNPMQQPAGGPPPTEQGGGGDMRPMLVKIIQKAMQAAESAGISFDEIVMEAKNSGVKTNQMPTPKSPSPSSPIPA